jgi:tRNA threonylcarbamoyladenosine biosynthesis protein TsaB
MILCLETATPVCSVALCSRDGIIAVRESHEGRSHASLLTKYIEELLEEVKMEPGNLEAVAVSKGPGSYTGLRIGVSAAKGIAYAASIPLIGVDTTISMFYGFISDPTICADLNKTDLFCPALDARRMEIYYTIFNSEGETIKGIGAEIIDDNSFTGFPESSRLFFFGDGALKFREVIKRKNSFFYDDFRISASFMHELAYKAYDSGRFEDVAYFEPFYLKDFLTSKPVKNIL